MIDIIQLTYNDIGRWVIYESSTGVKEKGRIKSWNNKYVFVVYKCNFEWDKFQDFTGCATNPEDIEFVNKGEVI